jgi:hypothetical protein
MLQYVTSTFTSSVPFALAADYANDLKKIFDDCKIKMYVQGFCLYYGDTIPEWFDDQESLQHYKGCNNDTAQKSNH